MNGLLQVSSYTAAIFRRTSHFVPKSCLYGCATISWKTKSFEHIGLELVLTRFRVHCYSSRRGTTKSASSRTRKLDSEPVMEQEKDAFFVVRKGDIVGVYKNFTDCQAQVGSSVIPFSHSYKFTVILLNFTHFIEFYALVFSCYALNLTSLVRVDSRYY
jgi:hypothetical protein